MYIKELAIEGYKSFNERTVINLHPGLNVLVGENGTGKSSIIDSIRLLLAEDEYGRVGIRDTDFHRPFCENAVVADHVQVQAQFSGLDEIEKVAFLPWMKNDDEALLTLRVENKQVSYGRYKRILWGGLSRDSMFEPELFDSISCTYLPPLRDAEASMRSGRNSRLARLLMNLNKSDIEDAKKNEKLLPLEEKVKKFNDNLANDEDDVIAKVNGLIQDRLTEALGQIFSQDTNVQFSSVDFRRIVEGLQLLFFPILGGAVENKELFRSLEENSLGYNNMLYLATILAEISTENDSDQFLKVLLIEEPEAHLHPQLQIRLLKYLEEQAKNTNLQIVVTTHSPVLSSSASLDSIIHLVKTENEIHTTQIKNCGFTPESKAYLSRWLDITKATLFYAKGILLVEGIAEAMLIPELAHRILKKYNESIEHEENKLPENLSDAGITIINMGGIYFEHFMQLFCNLTEKTDIENILIRCSGITDNDPPKESKPTFLYKIDGNNPAGKLIEKINTSTNCRLFVSPLKTFEYDLSMLGNNLRTMLSLKTFRPDKEEIQHLIDQFEHEEIGSDLWHDEKSKSDVSFYLLDHIDKGIYSQKLADKLKNEPDLEFMIPEYISSAILWVMGVEND